MQEIVECGPTLAHHASDHLHRTGRARQTGPDAALQRLRGLLPGRTLSARAAVVATAARRLYGFALAGRGGGLSLWGGAGAGGGAARGLATRATLDAAGAAPPVASAGPALDRRRPGL